MSLILSRRVGETICIASGKDLIRVTIHGVNGTSIKVGIDAPREVKVLREELMERARNEAEGEI